MLKDLTITKEQADFLAQCQQEAATAASLGNVAFSAVVRGHGLTQAGFARLEGTTLTVTVPDEPVAA